MSARSLSQMAVLALVVVGTLAVGTRYQGRQQTQQALADSQWRLTYDVSFEADPQVGEQESSATIRLGRPYPMPYLEILEEDPDETNPSLNLESWQSSTSGNREFRYETRHAGKYNLTTGYKLKLHAGSSGIRRPPLQSLSRYREGLYTQSENDFPTKHPSVVKVLQGMPEDLTVGEEIEWIYQYCLKELQSATEADEGDEVIWALEQRTSPLGRAKVFVTLCRAIDIPARLVVGFELRHSYDAAPHVWAEVHRENRWIPFDPVFGYEREMPNLFVPIRRGGADLIHPTGNKQGIKNCGCQVSHPTNAARGRGLASGSQAAFRYFRFDSLAAFASRYVVIDVVIALGGADYGGVPQSGGFANSRNVCPSTASNEFYLRRLGDRVGHAVGRDLRWVSRAIAVGATAFADGSAVEYCADDHHSMCCVRGFPLELLVSRTNDPIGLDSVGDSHHPD